MGNRPTPLRRAVRRTDAVEVRRLLMKAGKKASRLINEDYAADCILDSCNRSVGNVFYYAVLRNRLDIVRIMLDYGADVHSSTGYTDETVLHCAARNGDVELVRLLVEHGGDVYSTDDLGRTPLHSAARSPFDTSDTVRYILTEAGRPGDVNTKDFSGRTALHDAVAQGTASTARTLIQQGADVKAQSNLGHSPLYWAKAHNRHEMFSLLVDHGADGDGTAAPFDGEIATATHSI